MLEIIITITIVAVAVYILANNFKKKKNGGCNCSGCSSQCPAYKDKKGAEESN